MDFWPLAGSSAGRILMASTGGPFEDYELAVGDRYTPERDVTPEFFRLVNSWIRKNGEVFVVLWYLHAAGIKDFVFVDSPERFRQLVEYCPVGTDIIVFRDPQLPIREVVTYQLVARLAEEVGGWGEYLCVLVDSGPPGQPELNFGATGAGAAELVEELSMHLGNRIAVGPLPDYVGPDDEAKISRSKGGIDGPR